MNDSEIIALYFERSEVAIAETERKYQNYLVKIARSILRNPQDEQETVNDTYLKAWNTMPPHNPPRLRIFLGKITRQLSIDRWRGRTRQKRGGSEFELSLDELSECVSGGETPEESYDLSALAAEISAYLRTLPQEKRQVFLRRYYFCESVREIAEQLSESEPKIKSMLHRMREGLRKHLESEGYML